MYTYMYIHALHNGKERLHVHVSTVDNGMRISTDSCNQINFKIQQDRNKTSNCKVWPNWQFCFNCKFPTMYDRNDMTFISNIIEMW